MARRKQRWSAGDVFTIPLIDGSFSVGQVVTPAPGALNSVVCTFSSKRLLEKISPIDAPDVSSVIAIRFVSRDLLDSWRWEVSGYASNTWAAQRIDFQALERKGFVGVEITGSANIVSLMNAFHGLAPWNKFYDPLYLDKLLLSPELKPAKVMLIQ